MGVSLFVCSRKSLCRGTENINLYINMWFFQVLPSCGSVRRWGGGERFRLRPQKILELDTVRDSLDKELECSLISWYCPCSSFISYDRTRTSTGAEAGEVKNSEITYVKQFSSRSTANIVIYSRDCMKVWSKLKIYYRARIRIAG